MAIGMVDGLRNVEAQAIIDFVGVTPKLAIFSGTQPATGGTATTELYRGTLATDLGSTSAGVITMNLPPDTAASATGTASWARMFKTDGTTICFDMDCGTSGTTLILNSLSITSGVNVSVTSGTITIGNP